jgi:DNA-binding XRE family transcriptional regulator
MLYQFSEKLLELGVDIEAFKSKIRDFSNSLTSQDFDNECLSPEKFLEFCEFLEVSSRELHDKYYSFVFSHFGRALVQFREENNLTQKQFGKILKISPVDIGLFEKGLKYPTREQYLKLEEVLNEHAQ